MVLDPHQVPISMWPPVLVKRASHMPIRLCEDGRSGRDNRCLGCLSKQHLGLVFLRNPHGGFETLHISSHASTNLRLEKGPTTHQPLRQLWPQQGS
jgi:hypothetical protein